MNFKRLILFSLVSIFCKNVLISQSITINLRQPDKTPVEGASVMLKNLSDSSKYAGSTDKTGSIQFKNTGQGIYLLNIDFIGFQPIEKTIMLKSDKQSFEYTLKEKTVTLNEATVTANRPVIRQQDDKMIIDPEPLASISSNTLEVLESTPGLFVDPDAGIFLNTSSPATILINGREQKMGSQDISNILRNLPPGSVKHIEVIRSPSSKYSASSSGGVINIVLKRGVSIGRFGSANMGMNQGVYGNKFAGFSINNMGINSSSYLNLNFECTDNVEDLSSQKFMSQGTYLSQIAKTRRKSNQLYCGYGLGWEINDKLNINYDGRLNGSLPESNSNNTNVLHGFSGQDSVITNNLLTNENQFYSIQQDFGISYKIDTVGSAWDTKLSYSYLNNNIDQKYLIDNAFPELSTYSGNGTNLQKRNYFQFSSDFTYIIPKMVTFETGINSNWQSYENVSEFYVNTFETQVKDNSRTLSYRYQENINSAYLQASVTLPYKFLLKSGIRMEYTYMEGHQVIPSDTSFKVKRFDWFPYVYLSRPLLKIMGVKLDAYLIYRRTITRPDYNSLNPYTNYVDELLCEKGNPALNPQFTDNLEANISMDDMPILAFGKNYSSNIFSGVTYQDKERANVTIRTYDNLGKSSETYFRIMGGIPPGKKYYFALGAQYNYIEYDGFYDSQPFSYNRGSWRLFTFHSLQLSKNTRLTFNGFLLINGQMNFYEFENFGQLNIGLTQSFLDKKLTVMIRARDVLHTMENKFSINQVGIHSIGERYNDNQRIGINVRFNFGMKNKHEKQNMFQMED